jgi:predicted nucleotidyltransferase
MDRQVIADRVKTEGPSLRERYGVQSLALFGSMARGEAHPGSDLDLLVTFEPGRTPGLAYFALQDELTALLGQPVDLNTPAFLSPYFRDEVIREAIVLYDAR